MAGRDCAFGCLAVRLVHVCRLSLQPIGCTSALPCDVQCYCSCCLWRYIVLCLYLYLLPLFVLKVPLNSNQSINQCHLLFVSRARAARIVFLCTVLLCVQNLAKSSCLWSTCVHQLYVCPASLLRLNQPP